MRLWTKTQPLGVRVKIIEGGIAHKCSFQSSLDSILAPRLAALRSIAEGQLPSASQSIANLEEECLFELGVFSVLIASVQPKTGKPFNDLVWCCLLLTYGIEKTLRDKLPSALIVLLMKCKTRYGAYRLLCMCISVCRYSCSRIQRNICWLRHWHGSKES